jgi:RNA polymerase sigma factor (sigma-70 family)
MDFLTKPVDGSELLACVKQALDRCSQLQKQAHESQSIAAKLATLTEREKEVMILVIEGLTNKEIADRLGISFRTVENHRAQVMHKTDSSNMLELARIATRV